MGRSVLFSFSPQTEAARLPVWAGMVSPKLWPGDVRQELVFLARIIHKIPKKDTFGSAGGAGLGMLADCQSIAECESRLAAALEDHGRHHHREPLFLHELPLTQPDVSLIESLVKNLIKENPRGWVQFLVQRAPLFLAVFLVWRGIAGYRDGTYWPAVREITGISSRADEEALGAAFLKALHDYDLRAETDPEGLRYVTPILFHTGIPDACLPEFFREVVWRRFVARDVVEKEGVLLELGRLREERGRALQSEDRRRLEHLLGAKRTLLARRRFLEEYRALSGRLTSLQEQRRRVAELLDIDDEIVRREGERHRLLQDQDRSSRDRKILADQDRHLIASEPSLRQIEERLSAVEAELTVLLMDRERLRGRLAVFGTDPGVSDWERQLYRRLICEQEPEHWSWLRRTVLAFQAVPAMVGGTPPAGGGLAEQARELLRGYEALLARWNNLKDVLVTLRLDITRHCPVRLMGQAAVLRSRTDEFLGSANLSALCEDVRAAARRWLDLISDAKKRQATASATEAHVARQPAALEAELADKRAQRQQLIEWLKEHLDHEVTAAWPEWPQILGVLDKVEARYSRRLAVLKGDLDEALGRPVDAETFDAGTLDEEMHAAQDALNGLDRQVRSLEARVPVPPLSYVDKPIQRLLHYGGPAAERFVWPAVQLLLAALGGEAHKPAQWPQTYRHQRVWEVFGRWWQDEGRALCTTALRLPRPRLVCWRENGKWMVGVETPAELWNRPDLVVLHNEHKLVSRSRPWRCWPLAGLDGAVEVAGEEGVLVTLDLQAFWQLHQPCLVFRGSDDQDGPLPAVRRIPRGQVLVVVPEEWSREQADDEPATPPPEKVALPGYVAHHWRTERAAARITFVLPDGEKLALNAGAQEFFLAGEPGWSDNLDELGPVFGGAPRLIPARPECWQGVGTVTRLYRQTRRRGEQLLQMDARSPDGGLVVPVDPESHCYWVVLYDRQRYERERLAFRCLPGLREVRMVPEQAPVFPPPAGHGATAVEIVGDGAYALESAEGAEADARPPLCTGTPTGLRVDLPPDPRFDHLLLRLTATGGRPVPIRAVFERVWWGVDTEGREPGEVAWTDRPVELARDWFRPTSDKVLWLRWAGEGKRLGAVTKVYIGLDPDDRRAFPARQAGSLRLVRVPLYEFAAPLERPDRTLLRLWLEGVGAATIGFLPGLGSLRAPFLRGGKTIAGVAVAGGGPVYEAEGLPAVVLALRNRSDLRGWSVAVRREPAGEDQMEWQALTELSGITTGERAGGALEAVLDLASAALLGLEPVGRYVLRLRAPDGALYPLTLTVIPQFVYDFAPALLLPADQAQGSSVTGTVITAPDTHFAVKPPAMVTEVADEVVEFTVDVGAKTVAGTYLFQGSPEAMPHSLDIELALPRVWWRPAGGGATQETDQWTTTFREIWVGEASPGRFAVDVRLPPTRRWGGCLLVSDDDEPRVYAGEKQSEQHFRFVVDHPTRLSRTGDRAVRTLALDVHDHRRRPVRRGALLALRYRWEVVEPSVRWVCPLWGTEPLWLARWTDRGRVPGRRLELFKAWTPWEPALEWEIPDGAATLMLAAQGRTVPAGPYLLRFRGAEAGVETLQSDASLRTGANGFFMHLDDGRPHIRDLSCTWESEAPVVRGKAANCPAGVAVTVVLLGITGKAVVVARGTGAVGADGGFCIAVPGRTAAPEAGGGTGDASRYGFHWLAVFADSSPAAYQARILDRPAPLEVPWPGGAADRRGVWAAALGGAPAVSAGLGLKLRSLDGRMKDMVLTGHVSRQVLKCRREGPDELETKISVHNQSKKLRLRGLQGEAVIVEMEKGVVCTNPACPQRGRLLPSQQVWDREHYPKGCKQVEIRYRPFEAELTLLWDVRALLTMGRQHYPWARECYHVLGDSQTNPLPIAVAPSDAGVPGVDDLVAELAARELALAAALENGAEV
ncbi:hypothetical protein Daudx_1671 [Candidatus Desulforudis audaxviator]|nr:hypothetical protein Daudx_1671 [Candidatus Desulforudis audaxviator]